MTRWQVVSIVPIATGGTFEHRGPRFWRKKNADWFARRFDIEWSKWHGALTDSRVEEAPLNRWDRAMIIFVAFVILFAIAVLIEGTVRYTP